MPYAIDLFCGAGGCSEGLIQADFHILFSSDISDMVEVTYKHRHEQLGLIQGENTWFERSDIKDLTGEIINNRISSLTMFQNKSIPEIDLMIGGPSCQGFSRAGRRDKSDPRNMLFGEYVRVISEVRPKYIVLENVEGFVDMQFLGYKGITGIEYPDGSVTPDILRSELNEIGYKTLEPQILNAADYGVPQRRNRIIFIGYRDGLTPPEYPKPILTPDQHLTLLDAIGDLIVDDEVRREICPKHTAYQIASINGRTPTMSGKPIKAKSEKNIELPKQTDVVGERFTAPLAESGVPIVSVICAVYDVTEIIPFLLSLANVEQRSSTDPAVFRIVIKLLISAFWAFCYPKVIVHLKSVIINHPLQAPPQSYTQHHRIGSLLEEPYLSHFLCTLWLPQCPYKLLHCRCHRYKHCYIKVRSSMNRLLCFVLKRVSFLQIPSKDIASIHPNRLCWQSSLLSA